MKSYLRFLGRNKLYTAIEIVGLSLALAFVIPLINVVADKYERSRAHERYEDIYAVSYLGNLYTEVNFGDFLKERIPEIERTTSAMLGPRSIVDKEFFYFFPFEFIEGDESFLDSRENIAVSEKFAAMIAIAYLEDSALTAMTPSMSRAAVTLSNVSCSSYTITLAPLPMAVAI